MASFFFQAEDGIRDIGVTGVQTCALPIYRGGDPAPEGIRLGAAAASGSRRAHQGRAACGRRSEEHTSELQSRQYLVCRLLLEKKKNSSAQPSVFRTSCALRQHTTRTYSVP